MTKRNQVILFAISVIVAISVIYGINSILQQKVLNADVNLEARKIESATKMVLNGYLSAFFRFSYLGNISWLLIPLFLGYCYFFKPKWERKDYFVIVVIILSLVLIGAKGFFNPRYAYTVMALLIYFVFDFTWNITKVSSIKFMKYIALTTLCGFVFWNFYLEAVQVKLRAEKKESSKEQIMEVASISRIKTDVEDVISYIDSMKYDGNYLVDNAPEFYYHTNKKGVYYWNGDDMVFDKRNRWILMKGLSDLEVKSVLHDSLDCNFIITYSYYENYNKRFDSFISKNCQLIASDANNRLLYKVKDN